MRALLVLVLLGASAVGACTLLDDDPPENTCTIDSECFRAQGERCDRGSHTCVTFDAGVDAP